MITETIDHTTLTKLAEAGVVRSAHVVGQSGGWGILVKYGITERALAAQRSHQVRIFRKFETIVAYLKGVGIPRFDVDAVNYDSKVITHRRPDRAVAMTRAHEAVAYDTWFRAQVQEALDDPRPSIPHDEVVAEWAVERAELLSRVAKTR